MVDMGMEDFGGVFSGDGFLTWEEQSCFSKSVIHHNCYCIKSFTDRQIHDKVDRYLLKEVSGLGSNGKERKTWWMSIDLVLLTHCTSFDVIGNKCGQTWPPVE